jgi:hypothetical protein
MQMSKYETIEHERTEGSGKGCYKLYKQNYKHLDNGITLIAIKSKTYGLKIGRFPTMFFPIIKLYMWCVEKNRYTFYASTRIKKGSKQSTLKMHNLIKGMGINGNKIDHIDGNGLHNNLNNLRVVTSSQNNINQRIRKDNASGYKGVYYYKKK